jgi:DNA-3-methyladenine glycosylase I
MIFLIGFLNKKPLASNAISAYYQNHEQQSNKIPLHLGRKRPTPPRLPRYRVGYTRARQPRPLGVADARRLPSRPRLDNRASRKRDAFRKAFKGFDPAKVARFTEADIARLLQDPGIIRSCAKIEATIQAARMYLEMQKSGDDFASFLWSIVVGKPIRNEGAFPAQTPLAVEMSKQLKKRGFKFVGPVIVYAFMQAAGMVNDHSPACFRRNATHRKWPKNSAQLSALTGGMGRVDVAARNLRSFEAEIRYRQSRRLDCGAQPYSFEIGLRSAAQRWGFGGVIWVVLGLR